MLPCDPISLLAFLVLLLSSASGLPLLPFIDNELQSYIVHVKKPDHLRLRSASDLRSWHSSFLPNTTLFSGHPRLLHSYRRSISGFSALLTPSEALAMESMDGFVLSHPDRPLSLFTTYTPQFLSLDDWIVSSSAWEKSTYGEGAIIGVLDSGVSPSHPSFLDGGIPPPPLRWRGRCSLPVCNNKLIAARSFISDPSPSDLDGHGTHLAGIAAGNFVHQAHSSGLAPGRASGMAPSSHLAVYRACSGGVCRDGNVLAAIDQAIQDRIDVLLIPFGFPLPLPLHQDAVAASSFSASEHGILVCASAGNAGPRAGRIAHDSPWMITSGASTLDRRLRSTVHLGNGVNLVGEAAFQPPFLPTFLPLSFPGIDGDPAAANCRRRPLSLLDLRGKIVLCFAGEGDNVDRTRAAAAAGAAAVVLMNRRRHGLTTPASDLGIPTSRIGYFDGRRARSYVYTERSPTAAIAFNGTTFGARPSMAVAAFSSRGPGGGVLKPDVVAPGVNVMAAVPPAEFGFKSGTSVAAAHIAGVAALVRRRHPRWSPAMVQSALMTTAAFRDPDGMPLFDERSFNLSASRFAAGAGQVDPERAMNPGLVYDVETKHYLQYLCGLGHTSAQIWAITRHMVSCNKSTELAPEQLNYPSIKLSLGGSNSEKAVVRTVKSVRKKSTVYWARIEEPEGVRMDLSHYKLSFTRINQEESFQIKFRTQGQHHNTRKGRVAEGSLSWVSRTLQQTWEGARRSTEEFYPKMEVNELM